MSKHHRNSKLVTQKIIDSALENAQFWVGNTQYFSHNDIFKILLLSSLESTSVEETCDRLREESTGMIPSEDTVMTVLHRNYSNFALHDIENQISYNLQKLVKKLPYFKHKRSKVILAMDLHDEVYFGKPLFDDQGRQITMVGHNKKLGKSRLVFRTATISIVKWGKMLSKPITLAFAINYLGQPREEIVQRLMELIAPLNLRIKMVLMDGGFASREIFHELDRENANYIARGRYSKKKEYPINDVFIYQMFRPQHGNYDVYATINEVKDKKFLLLSSLELNKEEIIRMYKYRFRIENTYRHAKVVKIRTSTRKLQLRWLFWGISLLLELIWEIIRQINQISRIDKYKSRQIRINRMMSRLIIQYLADAKYRID